MKKEAKSLFKVMSSNIFNLIVGIITAFFIPKLLSPYEYGEYSLFILYVSYFGVLFLGYSDGIYLKYGGEDYNNIDKKLFSSFFYSLIIYTIMIIVSIVFLSRNIKIFEEISIIKLLIINILFFSINNFFILLSQATLKFTEYSLGNIIQKSVLLISTFSLLIFKYKVTNYFMYSLVLGNLLVACYYMYTYRQIVFNVPKIDKKVMKLNLENIRIGSFLMVSGISSMLVLGLGNIFVERFLGIEQLAYYAFSFSIMGIYIQFANAAGVIIYPILRKMNKIKFEKVVLKIDNYLSMGAPIILFSYYPCRYLLTIFFPRYLNSMSCLLFIFPLIILKTKRAIIYDSVYKCLRLERKMFYNILIINLLSVIFLFISIKYFGNIESVAFTTVVLFYIWNVISIIGYNKYSKIKLIIFDTNFLSIVIYLLVNIYFKYSYKNFILYLFFVIIYYIYILIKFLNYYKINKRRK